MTTKRAPAYPLIVHDPFVSIWSTSDTLTDGWSSHWTGRPQPICGLIRIDGVTYRFIGADTRMAAPRPALPQTQAEVTPTRTIYMFEGAGIGLTLTFTTPALPHDIQTLARPVTYITCDITSTDGTAHSVQLHLDISTNITCNNAEAQVIWGRHKHGSVTSLWAGAAEQATLTRSGDHVFTDWGYLHLSPDPNAPHTSGIGEARSLRDAFAANGSLPDQDGYNGASGTAMPAATSGGEGRTLEGGVRLRQQNNVLALSCDLGPITSGRWQTAVAYDHVAQISYHHRHLPPLWRQQDGTAIAMIARAWEQATDLQTQCATYDAELTTDMKSTGGDAFARLGTLAFRQCLGGHGLVADHDGTLLHFSKENSSNGCLGTVDLTYPGAPFFLLFAPRLLEAQLRFILDYAASDRWPFPFAPHDIGRYPLANGQVYGGGEIGEEDQMPYEECGNMLILAAALTRATTPDTLRRDWPTLRGWADYLLEHGHDPGEQLCTDDFDGHMARNVNLSLKAILGLGAAAQLAETLGEDGAPYRAGAEAGVAAWLASDADGAHRRQCFDRKDSWSLKYNLIWDRYLGLNLFPADVATGEMAKYRAELQPFGTPLSSVAKHTKLDWLVWAGCLTGERADLDAVLDPIDAWLDAAPDRVPLPDWYDTDTGRLALGHGFIARPVVGGVFMPMMLDPDLRQKWSSRR